MQIMGRELSV